MNDDQHYQMDTEKMEDHRFDEIVKVIVEASNKLQCTKFIRAKALIVYHSFKRCVHEVKYEKHIVAAASLSLSIKVFEAPIEIDTILSCIFSLLGMNPSTQDEHFKKMKNNLFCMESLILRMIEFSLDHVLAHQYLIFFIEDVKEFLPTDNERDVFVSVCLQFADDFYLSGKCLNYKPSEIAAVIILVGFYYLGVNFTKPECYLEEWVMRLENVSREKKWNLIDDIFEVSCLKPTAELQLKMKESQRSI